MRQNPKYRLFTIILLFGFHDIFASDPIENFAKERLKQGELHYKKAEEFFKDGNFSKSIETCKVFLILYPSHTREWDVRKLLSSNYRRTGDTLRLAENELRLYKDFPNTEEGLEAYLISGKTYVRLGREDLAAKFFSDITKNTFASKIAQEAELELTQMEILGESKNK